MGWDRRENCDSKSFMDVLLDHLNTECKTFIENTVNATLQQMHVASFLINFDENFIIQKNMQHQF